MDPMLLEIAEDEVMDAQGLDAAACAALAASLLSGAVALPLSSLTLEMGHVDGAAAGPFQAELQIDKKTRAVAFTTLTVKRDGALVFTARGLFAAAGKPD